MMGGEQRINLLGGLRIIYSNQPGLTFYCVEFDIIPQYFKVHVKYGSGWGYGKLKHCVRNAYLFSEDEIGYAVRSQLTWTHLRSLMGVKDPEKLRRAISIAREHYSELRQTKDI